MAETNNRRGDGNWLAKDGQKRCCRCQETKPVADFHKNRARPDGYHHYCKVCSKRAIKASDERHPESKKRRMRKTYLKRRYGVTPEQYDLMIWDQNNRCAICRQEMEKPHLDHDHETGTVRAMLCENCNRGLGMFQEDTELLLRAVSYLDSYKDRGPVEPAP